MECEQMQEELKKSIQKSIQRVSTQSTELELMTNSRNKDTCPPSEKLLSFQEKESDKDLNQYFQENMMNWTVITDQEPFEKLIWIQRKSRNNQHTLE
jgi:hypothetical protein